MRRKWGSIIYYTKFTSLTCKAGRGRRPRPGPQDQGPGAACGRRASAGASRRTGLAPLGASMCYIHKDIPCTKSQNNFCRFIMASNTMFRLLFLHSYSRRSHLMTVVSQSGRTLGAAAAVTIHRLTRRAGHLHCRVLV